MRKSLSIGVIIIFISVTMIPAVNTYTLHTNIQTKNVEQFNSNTLYVGGTGPNNYTRIQDAINDASDGDTVFVYSGTYYENIIIDRSINVIGEDKMTTIIDGSGSDRVVKIVADMINMGGFTIQNGGIWAGVLISSSSNIIITENIIIRNKWGIGLDNSDSSTISYNTISDNDDYGIFLHNHSDGNSIIDNTISNNRCGTSLVWSDSNTIAGNTFTDNGAGISLISCMKNGINYNNFMNSEYLHAGFQEGLSPSFNNWNRNYWDDWSGVGPKPILGAKWLPYGPGVPLPWLNFDLLPLLFPYN